MKQYNKLYIYKVHLLNDSIRQRELFG